MRLLRAGSILLALILFTTLLQPQVAQATITNVIATNASGDPLGPGVPDLTDQDELWAYVTSPSGGFVCLSEPVVEVAAASCVWAKTPVPPLFASYVPIMAGDLPPGNWVLGAFEIDATPTAISQEFHIGPCDNCTGVLAASAEFKAAQEELLHSMEVFCTLLTAADVLYNLKEPYQFGVATFTAATPTLIGYLAAGIETAGYTYYKIAGPPTKLFGSLGWAFWAFCTSLFGFPKIFDYPKGDYGLSAWVKAWIEDPPDPAYLSVNGPVFTDFDSLSIPADGLNGLRQSIDALRAYTSSGLNAFERYQAAFADGAQAYVHAQALQASDSMRGFVRESGEVADLLDGIATDLQSAFTGDQLAIPQEDIDLAAAFTDHIRTDGFLPEEIEQLATLGLGTEDLEQLRALWSLDLTGATGGRLDEAFANLARALRDGEASVELFARQAAVAAGRTNEPPTPAFTATPMSPSSLVVNFTDDSTSPDLDPIESSAWDFGDGETGEGSSVSHTYSSEGTYAVRLTVCDYLECDFEEGAISVGETPPNQPPVATDDTIATSKNTAGQANVLDNDSDPDGDPLTVASSTNGANGAVDCSGAGSCTYTPDTGFTGTDSFTYTTSDGRGGTDEGTVMVDVFEPASPVELVPTSTAFNTPIGIDYHEPTNQVVVSVNYPSGTPRNFELIASDGSHTAFSSVSGLTDEVKIATVRSGSCQGGFQVGELFVGTGAPGVIARITSDGSSIQNPWVTLPDEQGLLRGSLYQDRDCVFDGDLIVVTTAGGVWRVSSAGDASKLAQLDTHLEGVTVVPDQPAQYGPWAGTILAGAEGQARIYSIASDGAVRHYELGISPEDIDIVPSDANFFGVDFGSAEVKGAPASAFADKVGDVVMSQEFPGILWDVRWNEDVGVFEVSDVARVPQWEHITFAPAGINPISPTNNHVPIAVDDTLTTDVNTPGTVNVLANDSDPDPGDTLGVTSSTDGTHGTVECSRDGSCTYTPEQDFVGDDSFTYRVTDVRGGADSATVRVAVIGGRRSTSTTYTGGSSVQYSDPVTLSGTLLDTSVDPNIGIAGRQLEVTLGSQSTSAGPTLGDGSASTSLVVTQQPGSVTSVETSFAGDASYLPSGDSDPFEITKEDCTIAYTGDTLVNAANMTNLKAQFGEPDSSPGDWSGKQVTFTVKDSSMNTVATPMATTDSSGLASTQIALGPDVYAVSVSFAGDDFYNACQTPTDTLVTVEAANAKITGGGWVAQTVGNTYFGFNVIPDVTGLHGALQIRSRAGKDRFHSTQVSTLSTSGPAGTWTGTGIWDGVPSYTFTVSVVDHGSSGRRRGDTISIEIKNGSTTVFTTNGPQPLRGGNVTVH